MCSTNPFEYERPIGRISGGQRVAVVGSIEYHLRRIHRCIGDLDDMEDRSEERLKDVYSRTDVENHPCVRYHRLQIRLFGQVG